MIEFFCYSLVWIFALYGFIEIVKVLICTFINVKEPTNEKIHIVIGIKDAEEYVESFIRTFFYKIINSKYNDSIEVIIVDMNSKDNTNQILNMLNKDYNFELKQLNEVKQ